MQQAVERSVADRGAENDVRERRLLLRVQADAVFEQEPVQVRADGLREGERVARRQAHVADQGQAVAEVVRQLVQVAALTGSRREDVGAPALGLAGRRARRGPHVDELHLEHRRGCCHRRDHTLNLSQADLDREAVAIRLLALVDIGRDPFAVLEANDGLARDRRVAQIGLELRVVDRAEDDVLDVAAWCPSWTV